MLSAGLGAAAQLRDDHEIPLREFVTLGRKQHLRGFARTRFRGRYGWWGSAEYRYPVWGYKDTGVSLLSSLFVDVGRVADDLLDPLRKRPYYNGGIAIRGEHWSLAIFRFELAMSSEGLQFGFAIGKDLD